MSNTSTVSGHYYYDPVTTRRTMIRIERAVPEFYKVVEGQVLEGTIFEISGRPCDFQPDTQNIRLGPPVQKMDRHRPVDWIMRWRELSPLEQLALQAE